MLGIIQFLTTPGVSSSSSRGVASGATCSAWFERDGSLLGVLRCHFVASLFISPLAASWHFSGLVQPFYLIVEQVEHLQ